MSTNELLFPESATGERATLRRERTTGLTALAAVASGVADGYCCVAQKVVYLRQCRSDVGESAAAVLRWPAQTKDVPRG